ncbi:unnamed protein product [Protopolystoma xenopodis]|uniref:Uncharacterized protein n=1 Tax=Protopolystoma xenopodis TaxID=117903 RepID=A0A448X576_9PLAT|nr:unnamed protein product [Protopolystoma xenopodis]
MPSFPLSRLQLHTSLVQSPSSILTSIRPTLKSSSNDVCTSVTTISLTSLPCSSFFLFSFLLFLSALCRSTNNSQSLSATGLSDLAQGGCNHSFRLDRLFGCR